MIILATAQECSISHKCSTCLVPSLPAAAAVLNEAEKDTVWKRSSLRQTVEIIGIVYLFYPQSQVKFRNRSWVCALGRCSELPHSRLLEAAGAPYWAAGWLLAQLLILLKAVSCGGRGSRLQILVLIPGNINVAFEPNWLFFYSFIQNNCFKWLSEAHKRRIYSQVPLIGHDGVIFSVMSTLLFQQDIQTAG